jgi:hypothetical protein
MLAEREGNKIVVRAEYNDRDRCKEIPGHGYDSKRKLWRYPLSWATCVIMRGVFGDRLQIGPELAAWASDERVRRVDPALTAREGDA